MPDSPPFHGVLVDGVAPAKADFRAYHDGRLRVRFTVAEVIAADLSAVAAIEVGQSRFNRDTSDTTSAHDGVSVLVDAVGTRFLRVGDGVSGEVDFTGAWSGATTYAVNQSVSRAGSSWVSLVNSNLNNDPVSSPSHWQLLAGGKTITVSEDPPSGGLDGDIWFQV